MVCRIFFYRKITKSILLLKRDHLQDIILHCEICASYNDDVNYSLIEGTLCPFSKFEIKLTQCSKGLPVNFEGNLTF